MVKEWKTRAHAGLTRFICRDATRRRRNARQTLFLISRTDHRQELKMKADQIFAQYFIHFFQRPVCLVEDSTD